MNPSANATSSRWFVKGDWDGFIGLFVDNTIQLLLMATLGVAACGFTSEFMAQRILPGAAISILVGNLFYAWQARRLAARSGRTNVTALPFGINTIRMLAFIFLIMAPAFDESGDPDRAWRAGLIACLLSGVVETLGAFAGPWLRRHTPRPALLSSLAGVALSFMALGFTFQIFSAPLVAVIPLMLVIAV